MDPLYIHVNALTSNHVLSMAYAIGNAEPLTAIDGDIAEVMLSNAARPVVAHNARWHLRLLRDQLGVPWPAEVIDTLAASRGVLTDRRSYSLRELVGARSGQEVGATRALYRHVWPQTPEAERVLQRQTTRIQALSMVVDTASVANAIADLDTLQGEQLSTIAEHLGVDITGSLLDRGVIRHRLCELTGVNLSHTTSDGLPPEALLSATARPVLDLVARAGRVEAGINGLRRLTPRLDVNYSYALTRTLRWGCKGDAKGETNLMALPKHFKPVGTPFRSAIGFPDQLWAVRGDLMNTEYRLGPGWLARCPSLVDAFNDNPAADPYTAFWKAATGETVESGDPRRQLCKRLAVALTYFQGVRGCCHTLLPQVDLGEMAALVADRRWVVRTPSARRALDAGYPRELVAAVDNVRAMYLDVHASYERLMRDIWQVAFNVASGRHDYTPECAHEAIGSRVMVTPQKDPFGNTDIHVSFDSRFLPLRWRAIRMGTDAYGSPCPEIIKRGEYAPLTLSDVANNVVQHLARTVIADGKVQIEQLGGAREPGHGLVWDIHDEVIILERRRQRCEDARTRLASVFNGATGHYGWAAYIPYDTIDVGRTMLGNDDVAAAWEHRATCL